MYDGEEKALFNRMNDMSYEEKQIFLKQYSFLRKDRNLALILSVLFGQFGIDQFYIDKKVTGFLKLILTSLTFLFYIIFPIAVAIITLGILYVFVISHWLSIQEKVCKYNREVGLNIEVYIKN